MRRHTHEGRPNDGWDSLMYNQIEDE